jgi:RNA polymerase-binding protein DksA
VLGVAKKAKKTASRSGTRKAPAAAKKKSVRKATGKAAPAKGKTATALKKKPAAKAARKGAAKSSRRPKLGKTHLKAKQLQAYREMLLEKRRTLVGDLSGMANETFNTNGGSNLSSMPTHMADVGTDNFEHEFNLGLLESEQVMLKEINEALARIEDKTYGICQGTGKPIPAARLQAKPWAKYTVEFARMLEKGVVRPPDNDAGFDDEDDEDEQEQ